MAETEDPSKDGTDEGQPSLAMPSLSRRRKKAAAEKPTPEPEPDPEPTPEPTFQSEPEPVSPPNAQRVRRRPREVVRLPQLSGVAAALVTGAIVGGLAVGSVWLSSTACSAVRGTSSCGGGPGLVIWVATLLLLAYLGGWMLRGFGVAEAGSTSFLGLGVAVVVLLAFFSQSFDQEWMAVVAPLMVMGGYALAWWVTNRLASQE